MNCFLKSGLAGLALAAGLQTATSPAYAALLASERFNYSDPVDTGINGLSGGSGWIEAWPSPSGAIVLADGVNYTGVFTLGRSVAVPVNANFGNGGRDWSATLTDGTYWYSFLVLPEVNGRGTFVPFKRTDDNQNGFGLRIDNDSGFPHFKAWTPQQSAGASLDFPGGYDGSAFFVLGRVQINIAAGQTSTNTIWVFKSPDAIPATEGELGGASVATSTAAQAATVAATFGGRNFSSGGLVRYDEIRIGEAFEDVIPSAVAEPQFSVTPAAGVQNQLLTFDWSFIPDGYTSLRLNPGNVDVAGLTFGGTGQTTLNAPALDTAYTLTIVAGGKTTVLTSEYTALAPSFTVEPPTAFELDNLNMSWLVPAGSDPVSISPGLGDVTWLTDYYKGTGSTVTLAPGSSTTYVLSYTFGGATHTLTQQFTLAEAFIDVPSPVIENSPLPIHWRIPVGFSSVMLEYGPDAGPYTGVDVTANTDVLGVGSYDALVASLSNTNFFLRYTNSGVGRVASNSIVVYPQIFTDLVAVNNLYDVVINPNPMNDGVAAYVDRSHVWAEVPEILRGAQFVRFAQNEKTTAGLQVSFTAAKDATFFLLIDNRIGDDVGGNNPVAGTDNPPTMTSVMTWVLGSGFVDSGLDIGLDENPVAGSTTIDQSYSVFFRQVASGETYTFFEQNDGNFRNMYGVAGVAPQVSPVAFVAIPGVINAGETTTLQWTVPAGSTVSIDNGIGDVTSLTDPTFGTGSASIAPLGGTHEYILTYDPPGSATPPVNLGPVTVVVNSLTVPELTYSAEGANLTLEWSIDYYGWILQTQSNPLTVGITTNWVDVLGSEADTTETIPIDPATASQFFRLRQP